MEEAEAMLEAATEMQAAHGPFQSQLVNGGDFPHGVLLGVKGVRNGCSFGPSWVIAGSA